MPDTLYTYIVSDLPQKERDWLMEIHPNREFIETDVFAPVVSWMDNSLAVQESLRGKGREDLIRPLPGDADA